MLNVGKFHFDNDYLIINICYFYVLCLPFLNQLEKNTILHYNFAASHFCVKEVQESMLDK